MQDLLLFLIRLSWHSYMTSMVLYERWQMIFFSSVKGIGRPVYIEFKISIGKLDEYNDQCEEMMNIFHSRWTGIYCKYFNWMETLSCP